MGTITLRNKQTTGGGAAVLEVGELALNTVDEQVYMRDSGGSINVIVGTTHGATGVSLAATANSAAATALLDDFATAATTSGLVPGSNSGGSSVFLNGSGAWSVPGGGGDVSKVSTPVDSQIGVWTGDGTIEGDAAFTFDTSSDLFNVGATNDGTIQLGGTTIVDNATGTITLSNINDYGLAAGDIPDISATYQPLGNELTALQALADTAGFLKKTGDGAYSIDATSYEVADAAIVKTGTTGNASWTWIIDEDNMSSDSNTHVPTQQSVKKYVDDSIAGGSTYIGGFDPTASAGAGLPDLDAKSDTSIGDMYTVTVAGTYTWTTGSAELEVGDVLIAESSGTLNDVADWTIVNKNLGAVAPDINSTVTDSAPDIAADFMMFYDTTEGVHNKLLIQDIPMDGGAWT